MRGGALAGGGGAGRSWDISDSSTQLSAIAKRVWYRKGSLTGRGARVTEANEQAGHDRSSVLSIGWPSSSEFSERTLSPVGVQITKTSSELISGFCGGLAQLCSSGIRICKHRDIIAVNAKNARRDKKRGEKPLFFVVALFTFFLTRCSVLNVVVVGLKMREKRSFNQSKIIFTCDFKQY
nr:hypothetical protein [Kiloniella spongiae]